MIYINKIIYDKYKYKYICDGNIENDRGDMKKRWASLVQDFVNMPLFHTSHRRAMIPEEPLPVRQTGETWPEIWCHLYGNTSESRHLDTLMINVFDEDNASWCMSLFFLFISSFSSPIFSWVYIHHWCTIFVDLPPSTTILKK